MDAEVTPLLHPHHEKWQPLRNKAGEPITVTWDQVWAVHHAMRCVDEMRRLHGTHPPLTLDFLGLKSRALGRLLIDGKPLFQDVPPYSWGAGDYGQWDLENERGDKPPDRRCVECGLAIEPDADGWGHVGAAQSHDSQAFKDFWDLGCADPRPA